MARWARERLPHHGHAQRHARLVLRRRRFLDPAAAIAHGRGCSRRGRRHPRRRRRVDAARAPSRSPAEEELRRVEPVIAALADSGAARDLHRHVKRRGRRGGARRGRRRRQRRDRASAPSRSWRASSPTAARDCCLMHMRGAPRTMQADPRLRRRRLRRQGVPRASGSPLAVAPASPRSGSSSTRASASARRSSTTSSCCGASTRSWRSAGRSWSAPRASRFLGSSPAARSPTACRGRSRRTCSRSSVAPPSSAFTTSARSGTRSRWRLLRCAAHEPDLRTTTPDDEFEDELKGSTTTRTTSPQSPSSRSRSAGSRSTPTTASRRPNARSASGSCSTCGSRSASATRRHRPCRGHRSTTARSASTVALVGAAALLQDARATLHGDRRPSARRLRGRGRRGQGGQPEPPIPLPVEDVSVEVFREPREYPAAVPEHAAISARAGG